MQAKQPAIKLQRSTWPGIRFDSCIMDDTTAEAQGYADSRVSSPEIF